MYQSVYVPVHDKGAWFNEIRFAVKNEIYCVFNYTNIILQNGFLEFFTSRQLHET